MCKKRVSNTPLKTPYLNAMKNIKFYLDARNVKTPVVKIRITKNKSVAFISTDIRIEQEQWDSVSGSVINHPRARTINAHLNNIMIEVEDIMLRHSADFREMTASEMVKKIKALLNPEEAEAEDPKDLFFPRALQYMERCEKKRTKELYAATLSRIRAYTPDYERLRFKDITIDWLTDFDKFLQKTSPSKNSRNIHFRNIRTIFNDAIDDEVTTLYPFRKFKLKNEATVKRSLTVEQLAMLFTYRPKKSAERYIDVLKLMFYLIGINLVDLMSLKKIVAGRVEYHRAKTNRLYSIKVEPEAMAIINKYRGDHLLIGFFDTYGEYTSFSKLINRNLHPLGKEMDAYYGESIFENLTTYWMRHTWATIAAELDIPKETIAKALGHGGNEVTDVYIRFDDKKIDKANRQVIDYVNEHIAKLGSR